VYNVQLIQNSQKSQGEFPKSHRGIPKRIPRPQKEFQQGIPKRIPLKKNSIKDTKVSIKDTKVFH